MEKWDSILEWVIKGQGGDKEAIGEIYSCCVDYVYRRVRHLLRNDQDAEDATQAVFIEVLNSLQKLKEPSAFKGWLNKIILHTCYHYYKSTDYKNPSTVLEDDSYDDVDPFSNEQEDMPLSIIEKTETKEALMTIIDSLPPEQKYTVIMYYYYHCTVGEIAEITECSTGTVKSRLNYARKEMRRQIEEKRKKGIAFPAVVPLPVIGYLIEEVLAQINVPSSIVSSIPQALNAKSAAAVSKPAMLSKPAMTVATKILIGAVASAIVIVGIVLLNEDEKLPVDGVLSQYEVSNESHQSAQTGEPTDEGAEETVSVAELDYAQLYYDYIENELKPNGLWDRQFYDADMVDMNGDGAPELLVIIDSDFVVMYHVVVSGGTASVEELSVTMLTQSSSDDIVESSKGHAVYLVQYNGAKYIANYSTYSFIEKSNGLEIPRHYIDLYGINGSKSFPVYSFGYYASQGDGITATGQIHNHKDSGDVDTVNLSEAETNALYAELTVAASNWGRVIGNNNAGFDFDNTNGQRIRDYITE